MNHASSATTCESCGTPLLSRRQLLRIGGLGSLGLNLCGLLRAEAEQRSSSKVKSCILIFYYGGPSHLDTFDMKPDAPSEVRGEFKPISTSVPGLHIGEHQPLTARVMHKIAVIRSMHHPMTNHNAAAVAALCGRSPVKGDLELLEDDALSFPCYGSALSYLMRDSTPTPTLPHKGGGGTNPISRAHAEEGTGSGLHVAIPRPMRNVVKLPGQGGGLLGSAFDPLQIDADPNAPDFRVAELELPASMTLQRLEQRESLLRLINRQFDEVGSSAIHRASHMTTTTQRAINRATTNPFTQRAFSLLRSPQVRRAFDLGQEAQRTRDRYGRNIHGQSVLLARRLVEAGARFVSVYDKFVNGQDDNWDSHAKVFSRLKDHLLPPADQAFSALIEDLDQRGLLESTLVVALGEFGRTPKINPGGGRDHWPHCFSVVLAGGGVKGGTAYGASDAQGGYPSSDPVSPGDLAATLFWRFGLDPETEMRDALGRPLRLAEGQPVRELFES